MKNYILQFMIHLRMLYYVGTGIITFGISLIIFSLLKRKFLERVNLTFLIFTMLSSIHLILIFLHLYLRVNMDSSLDMLLKIAVMISRGRMVSYIFFVHSLSKQKTMRKFDIIIIPGSVVLLFVNSTWTTFFIVIYCFIFLVCLLLCRHGQNNRYFNLIKSFSIISGVTLIPFLLDILEELTPYLHIMELDFFPICIILFGIIFIITILRNNRVVNMPYKTNLSLITKRENEVIDQILLGYTNKNISEKLFISESTVKKHIHNIFKKLDIKSRWELVKLVQK